jgi:hypothetical protein
MTDSANEPIDWDAVEDLWKKLMLICDRHRIELTADGDVPWEHLAIALLLEHEPSYRSLRKRCRGGRPRDWRKDIALILDADHVIGERHCSDSGAIHIMTTSPRFARRWNGENERTLRNRLSAARKDKELAITIQKAREEARDRGFADLWGVMDQNIASLSRSASPRKER